MHSKSILWMYFRSEVEDIPGLAVGWLVQMSVIERLPVNLLRTAWNATGRCHVGQPHTVSVLRPQSGLKDCVSYPAHHTHRQ